MKLSSGQRTQIMDLIGLGKGRNEIARLMQVSPAVVSKMAKDAGIAFDRTATEQATQARAVDNKARRAQLEEDLLKDAANLRTLMWLPKVYRSYVGKDGDLREDFEKQPHPRDQLDLMRACALAVDKSLRLAEANTDQGVDAARSMLGNLFTAMGAAVAETTEAQ